MNRLLLGVWLITVPSLFAADTLTGTWVADARSKGGIGTTLIFTGDGNVSSILGAIVDFTYRVDGAVLTTTFHDNPTGSNTVMHQAFELKGDKLIMEPADAQKRLEMTRVSAPATGIAGGWTYEFAEGKPARQRFNPDGSGQLTIPMQTRTGRYTLAGDALTMEFPGEPPYTRKIAVAGNHLTLLPEEDRREQKFTRVAP